MAGVHFNRGWFKSVCLCENQEWSTNGVGENSIVSWWRWALTDTENWRNLVFAEHYNPLKIENCVPNICATDRIDKTTAKWTKNPRGLQWKGHHVHTHLFVIVFACVLVHSVAVMVSD